jgi:hypothetical protein
MKLATIAKFAAVGGVAFLGLRIALKAKDALDAGADVAKAVADAVTQVVTEDLNPASDKNVVYRGVNSIGTQITQDSSFNLGNKLWEWFNPAQVAKEKGLLSGASPSNVQEQNQLLDIQNDEFRAAEITAQNLAAKAEDAVEEQMSRSKTNFRISEIIEQKNPSQTDWGKFQQNLSRARNSS